MRDDVEHSMVKHELGGLKTVGQILADRLLDHSRTRKADQRSRFAHNRIAEHREACAHATHRRIRQHRYVRNAPLGKLRQERRRLGHLHEREHALLHARAAGCGDQHQRVLPLEGALSEPGDLRTNYRAHRAAHEREIHHAEIYWHSAKIPGNGHERVIVASVRQRLLESRRIFRETDRVHRANLDVQLVVAVVVEQQIYVIHRTNATMEVAIRADIEITNELLAKIGVAARLALFPGVWRYLEFFASRLPGLPLFPKPSHSGNLADWSVPGKRGGPARDGSGLGRARGELNYRRGTENKTETQRTAECEMCTEHGFAHLPKHPLCLSVLLCVSAVRQLSFSDRYPTRTKSPIPLLALRDPRSRCAS